MQYVFVYGTLRAGEANDINRAAERHDLATPEYLGAAHVRGHLFDFGAYPGLVLDDDTGAPIRGDIFRIEESLVPVLDEIEEVYPGVEGLFRSHRMHVEVELDGTRTRIDCLMYPVSAQSVAGLPKISSGDWLVR
ncbi:MULTISPECIES: gamma-glutamylcyclotransferase [unclassified Caballeronia]|uniref:gamma-glutamylcyclotransferase family protein n=1 Tax=unclassified Caballeronia TaxID=2646786 RepID=UPI002028316F|nr:MULTISPECIES: gamma-glutamylcyclotransferase family protein [unclassified Caballeronia]MDR5804684.1 gamma-glutamylcyclotransferase [Caballeronia sp. LZ001]